MELHVCPLAAVDETVTTHRASHLLTLLGPLEMIGERAGMAPGRHLRIRINDIVEAGDGLVLAEADHVRQIVDFAHAWDRAGPMVVHCWAGVSRSTAAAYIILCALNESVAEDRLAVRLRQAAPYARPNPRLVGLADRLLGRRGRMTDAVRFLPDAELAGMGRPFRMAARQAP